MAAFPPEVERWRPLVQKYFPPELVNKALWVIMYESSGNPDNPGDGGVARGLFQIQDNRAWPGRPDAKYLDDPENNIRYAAQVLGAAKGNWAHWGENNLYNGKIFGALGHNPYPGDDALQRMDTIRGGRYTPAQSRGQPVAITPRVEDVEGPPGYGDTTGGFGFDFTQPVDPIAQGQLDLEREMFEYKKQYDDWYRQYQDGQAAWQRFMDERDYWLALGEYDLANQAQINANYWQQQNIMLQQQLALAEHELAKYQTDLNYQIAYAQATSDADRNRLNKARDQELAAIEKMKDDTARAISGKQLNIDAYGAETERQLGLGSLAQQNNEFIQRLYSNPRDHFGLFFMQRGVTPDWDQLAQGNVIQGDPLRVRDPLSVFNPTVTMPTDFNITPGQSYGQVGSFSGGVQLRDPTAGLPAPGNLPSLKGPQFTPVGQPPQAPKSTGVPGSFSGGQSYTDINPGGLQGGVPAALLKPGLNLSTFGAVGGQGGYGRDFNTGTAFWDMGMTRPIGSDEYIAPGSQVWINYNPNPSGLTVPVSAGSNTVSPRSGGIPQIPGQEYVPGMPMYAEGTISQIADFFGNNSPFIRDRMFMAGDNNNRNPFSGGAKPEAIINPTGAPLAIANTNQTKNIIGDLKNRYPRNSVPSMFADFGNFFRNLPQRGGPFANIMPAWQNYRGMMSQVPQQFGTYGPQSGVMTSPLVSQFADYGYYGPTVNQPQDIMNDRYEAARRSYVNAYGRPTGFNPNQPLVGDNFNMFGGGQLPRYASGTLPDVAGPLGIRNSNNDWARGTQNIPSQMRMLMDYGMPIAPGTLGAVTGNPGAPLNVSTAFAARGGGILPSLQTLRGMPTGERANFQGYAEGPVGISYADIIDYLTGATRKLGRAQASGEIRYGR